LSEQSNQRQDATTTVADLRKLVHTFVAERDWQQFHAPKNLAMALSIEAAELMEHFQWLQVDESRKVNEDSAKLLGISEELADVICYAVAIANELEIDISAAMHAKMVKNRLKYPVEEYKGRYGPEDQPEDNREVSS
jgi:dCTP diphosphatase